MKNIFSPGCVAQWIGRRPVNQRVTGSIPSEDTCLGCGPGPHVGAHERQVHINVSFPLFLPLFLSKNKYIKSFLKRKNTLKSHSAE